MSLYKNADSGTWYAMCWFTDWKGERKQKLDAMLNRQLYSQYKTAPTEEQREQARQEYLDRRGVPESYRWIISPWER